MDPETLRTVGRVEHGGVTDPDVLDFSANTNPRTPDGVESVYEGALASSRRYPEEPPTAFVEVAADYADSDPSAVVPTPGGLAAIRLAIESTVRAGDSVLVPTPSFGEYAREVRLQGANPVFVPHEDLLAADPGEHAMAIVCNPNNPTGDAVDRDRLMSFVGRCRETGTVVLVDEAFLGFTEQPSLAGTPGTIVARSLTKLFGLPGLRAGFAVAAGEGGGGAVGDVVELAEALHAARRPWNVGGPALATGAFCMRQSGFVAETRRRVATERERMREAISSRFDVRPSEAPFLLLDVGDGDVDDLIRQARSAGIAIRDARTFRGLDSHVRVAVKDRAANTRLLEALDVR